VRSELDPELGRIDASVSTRLSAADYVAAPTPADYIAGEQGIIVLGMGLDAPERLEIEESSSIIDVFVDDGTVDIEVC
jgi:hypothetical protein